MDKKKNTGFAQFLSGKGFLLATIMGIAAVGVSTFIAYDHAIDKISGTVPTETDTIVFTHGTDKAVAAPQTDIPKTSPPTSEKPVQAPQLVIPPAVDEPAGNLIGKDKNKKVMPLDGEIVNPFSDGELVKSKTLGVWKTHDGIDIAADLGASVVSVGDGKVTEVYDDPLWGTCVLVDYGDGATGHYYGLDKALFVTVGKSLKTGDPVGVVGNTAQIEVAEVPHLHFAVSLNGNWINPADFIK